MAMRYGRSVRMGVWDRITARGKLCPRRTRGMDPRKVKKLRQKYVRTLFDRSENSWGTTTYDWIQGVVNGYK